VLDTCARTFIIYIWYEDGSLRPSLVNLDWKVEFASLTLTRRGYLKSDGGRHRVSVPGGSHT